MAIGSSTRQAPSRLGRHEEGYVLLVLLLVVTLMVIAAAAAAPTISFEIRRDREEEMIHRGVQYSRAIGAYYKKFGRYPTRLEDLDNTNNLRYLRKHYTDPLNKNKDFKLLHYGDPGVSLGGFGSLGGGSIPGANTVGSMNAGGSSGSAFGGSGFGGSSFSQSSSLGGSSNSTFGGSSGGFGGSSNSSFGGGFGNSASSGNAGGSSSGSGNQAGGTDSSQTGTSNSQDASSTENGTGGSTGSSGQQTFGGGPIVGVASVCKERTIREFNKRKKYNEWQFVYDPTTDRGGLLTTPYQPLQAVASQPGMGQPANSSGSSFGQPSGFGNSNSAFSSSGSNNSGFMSTPAQPPSTTPQPQ